MALTRRWCAPFTKQISICGSGVPNWFSRWLIVIVACGLSLMVGIVFLAFYGAAFVARYALHMRSGSRPRQVQ